MSEPFHVVIHPAALKEPSREVVEIDGGNRRPREMTDTFECSFEDVARAFDQLPRMFLEPDGSFVWVNESGGQRFQLDGGLVDNGTRMLSVELKGTCNEEVLEALLSTFGWPRQELKFQLVQQGIYISESEFRRAFVAK